THRTSVGVRQHTQDVRCGLWLSVSTHRTSLDVRVCPCVSVCDVRVCPSEHTGRRPWLSISTHISTLVLGLSMLALPVDCLGDFGQRGLSVQYTQDVRRCPPAHTGRRPWLSVSTHRTSVAVCGCPCVSVSTHWTSVAVHQYTYQHTGPWTQHAGPSRGLFGTHRTSVSVRQHTQDVRVCPCVSVSTHRTSVADVRGCPCVSVCVRQHTQDVRGCPSVHISARRSLDSARWPFPWTVSVILSQVGCLFSTHRTSMGVRQHTQDVQGCLWLSVSTHMTSVCVRVCLSAQTGCSRVSVSTHRTSVCVRMHTKDVCGCPCVSVSTHRTSVAVHQYTYQ
ncbi:unnamed protein product, partial [Brassica rapa]